MMPFPTIRTNIALVSSSFYTLRSTGLYEASLVENALSIIGIEGKPDFKQKYKIFTHGNKKNYRDTYDIEFIYNNNVFCIESLYLVIVPGAMEIPQACRWVMEKFQLNGILALGCVIRGKTTHYDHVCHTAISGIGNLALKENLLITNAIVTAENDDLAKERCFAEFNGKPAKNLGLHGMEALLEMIALKHKIHENSN